MYKCVETIYLGTLIKKNAHKIVQALGKPKDFCTEEVASPNLVDPANYLASDYYNKLYYPQRD